MEIEVIKDKQGDVGKDTEIYIIWIEERIKLELEC